MAQEEVGGLVNSTGLAALSQGAEAVGLIPEWDRLPHREKVPKVTGCFPTPRLGQI